MEASPTASTRWNYATLSPGIDAFPAGFVDSSSHSANAVPDWDHGPIPASNRANERQGEVVRKLLPGPQLGNGNDTGQRVLTLTIVGTIEEAAASLAGCDEW